MVKFVLSVLMALAAVGAQVSDPVEEANRLAREGETEAARVLLEETLAEQPLAIEANRALQDLLEPEEARARYAELFERFPETAEARYLWGRVLSSDGDWESASEYFRGAVEIDPGLAWAAWAMSITEQRKGNAEEALGWMLRGLEANPESDQLVGYTNTVMSMMGHASPESSRILAEALRVDPLAARRNVAYWTSRLLVDPSEEVKQEVLGELEELWDSLDDVEELQSLAMFPERPPLADAELSRRLWIDLGTRFPDDPHASYFLIRAATRNEDWDTAIPLLERSFDEHPGSAYRSTAAELLLASYLNRIRPDEALGFAERLRAAPDRRDLDLAAARETRMYGYPRWGELLESIGYVGWYLAAQSKESDESAETESATLFGFPAADHLTDEGRRAAQSFRDAAVPDPWGYRFLSQELGRLEEEPRLRAELAERAYASLMADDPASRILVNRGWGPQKAEREVVTRVDILSEVARARAGSGDFGSAAAAADEILAALEIAEVRESTYATAHSAAAEAYEAAGHDERALEQYMRALAYKSGDPEIEAALERLYAAVGGGADLEADLSDVRPPMEDFELRDLEGNAVRLSDYRGRPVLVNFWATWCGPCVAEMPHLEQLAARYRDRGFEVLAVSVDSDRSRIRPFLDKYGVDLPVLLGTTELSDRYSAEVIPTNILVDPEGRIRARHVGFLARDVDRWFDYWTGLLEPMLR